MRIPHRLFILPAVAALAAALPAQDEAVAPSGEQPAQAVRTTPPVTTPYSEAELLETFGYMIATRTPLSLGWSEEQFQSILDGVRRGMEGDEPADLQLRMQQLNTFLRDKMQEEAAGETTENKAAGAAFIEEKLKEEGVEQTESGLAYKILEPGEGESPSPQDEITIHYTGTFLDGTVFDSSRERGQPATFQLGGLIPGWIEGLQLIEEGGRIELYIPSELAYGDQPGGRIPPGSTLIFDVELIEVGAKTPPPPPPAEAFGVEPGTKAPATPPPPPPGATPPSGPPSN